MKTEQLIREAERVVAGERERLPESIRAAARELPVVYFDWPTEEILGGEFEPDILGLFVGEPHGSEGAGAGGVPAQILLFVENIYDAAEGDLDTYREEVKLTYLHELGHFLGWDEDELDARGLG